MIVHPHFTRDVDELAGVSQRATTVEVGGVLTALLEPVGGLAGQRAGRHVHDHTGHGEALLHQLHRSVVQASGSGGVTARQRLGVVDRQGRDGRRPTLLAGEVPHDAHEPGLHPLLDLGGGQDVDAAVEALRHVVLTLGALLVAPGLVLRGAGLSDLARSFAVALLLVRHVDVLPSRVRLDLSLSIK